MALLQKWRDVAYSQEADRGQLQKFWTNYFLIEKGIYEKLLTNPDEVVRGTVTGRKIRTGCPDYGWFPGWNQ